MDTLVLDMSYIPIGRISWRRAVLKLLKGTAEVVEEYDDREIHCGQFTWKMPSIIRVLRQVVGMFRRGVKFNRANIYFRDKGRCAYCGCKVSMDDFEFEHVIPKNQGGKTSWENIVASCSACNQRKRNRTPEQARMRLRTKPVKPKYVPGSILSLFKDPDHVPKTWRDYLMSIGYWTVSLDP